MFSERFSTSKFKKKNTDQEIKNKEVIEAIHERDLQNPRLDSFKPNFR